MKITNQFITLSFGLASLLFSCQSEKNSQPQEAPSLEIATKTVQEYVEDNTFIDVDVKCLAKDITSSISNNQTADAEQIAKAKAALYRFYSHVQLIDDIYKCDISKAADINVSDDVFKVLLANLDKMNAAITKAHKDGKSIEVKKINQEYLNQLLK